ncbi:MAG: hypothetical protein AAFS05_13480 [Pseudomonadota bacterium]
MPGFTGMPSGMEHSQKKLGESPLVGLAIAGAALAGLFVLGYFDPLPEQDTQASSAFVYYGPAGETVSIPGAVPADRAAAETALEGTDYFGAFAAGPRGRTGLWTQAWTRDLARAYALAACGQGCRIVAERLPLHRDPARDDTIATTAMARNLAVKWPFGHDYIATGGAGAWGHRTKPAGKTGRKRAIRDAAAECELRRAAEAAPDPALSPPCIVQRLTEIEDLRPKPTLYPAAYTLEPTPLTPVAETRLVATEGAARKGALGRFGKYQPPRLWGARAANGASSFEVVRQAGWPEAGEAIALTKCNAERRPGEGACVVTRIRKPDSAVPEGHLAVSPELYEAYRAWQATDGAGAFAISPYGVWGSSRGYADVDEAIQKAADWCWYYTRRNWEYRQVDRAFLDAGVVCRVVEVRG